MICQNCGKELKDGSKFCLFCGTPQLAAFSKPAQTPVSSKLPVNELLDEMTMDPDEFQDAQARKRYEEDAPEMTEVQGGYAPYTEYPKTMQNDPMSQTAQMPQMPQNQGYYAAPQGMSQPVMPQQRVAAPKKKAKKNVALPIVLGIVSVILIALIVVLVLMITGTIDISQIGKGGTTTSISREDDEDEEEARDKDKDKDDKDDEETGKKDEQEKDDQGSKNEEPAASSGSVTLSCGAVIAAETTYSLDLSEYSVDSLEGIEKVVNLDTLIIDGGTLTDLTPLSSLEHLRTLVINNVPVTDLTPLIGVTTLENLTFFDSEVDAAAAQTFRDARPEVAMGAYAYSEYVVVQDKVSWTTAKAAAEERGGHLAVITTEEEMRKAVEVLKQCGLIYVWLGGYSEEGTWFTVTGEPWGYTNWWGDEPSGQDQDGTAEDKLCIWNIDGEWTENDQRDNLPMIISGNNLGYLVEFEYLTGKKPQ